MANSEKINRDGGIDYIKVFATIAVVMIHGKNIYGYANVNIDNNYIVNTIAFIMSSGVPLFFITSGYLWGLKTKRSTINTKKEVIKTWNTLIIPYLIINLIWLMFELIISFTLKSYLDVSSFSFVDIISYVTWNPIYSPFWFIRNLVVIKICSILVERIHTMAIDYLAAVFLILGLFMPVIIDEHANVTLIYYGMGIILSRQYQKVNTLLNRIGRKEIISLLAIVITCLILNLVIDNPYVNRILMILLVLAEVVIIGTYGRRANATSIVDIIGANSFFIYAFHGKILSALQIIAIKLFNTNSVVLFIEYFGLPLALIIMLVLSSEVIKKHIPGFYRLITGGR